MATAGDRRDDDIRDLGRVAARFFDHIIIREDRNIVDLLDADYTFVDERLARHYGIPNVKGSLFRRVTLPKDDPRRGVLGKGSVLLVTSVANRTSPVQRGQFVLENMLGAKAPNPPPGVEPDLRARSLNVQAVNCVPWSEWITVPRIASRWSIAIPRALQVSAAVGLWLIDQPTTRRLNASSTTAQ